MGRVYPKCVVEGCGRNVIWEQTHNKIPMCPQCTKTMLVFKWMLDNLQLARGTTTDTEQYSVGSEGNIKIH